MPLQHHTASQAFWHTRRSIVLTFICVCMGVCPHAWAQPLPPTSASQTEEEPDASQTVDTQASQSIAWGVGMFRYTEPGLMQLTGPEAALQWQYQSHAGFGPERLQLDLGAASLQYDSATTGNLSQRPALTGRGTSLWRLHASAHGVWRAGLQLDMVWTDLRGTSSTGHRGYRRLGSKIWAALQHETTEGARSELGILLRGRQDSLLSDIGGPDVSNTQRRGFYLGYQHSPLESLWQRPRLWGRYSQIDRSDNHGIYYEPRNSTLQLGVLFEMK